MNNVPSCFRGFISHFACLTSALTVFILMRKKSFSWKFHLHSRWISICVKGLGLAERHSCRLFLFKVTALFSFCLLLNDIFNTVKLRMGGEKIENEWWKLLGEEDASKSSCLLHGGYGLREAKFVGPFFLYHSHLLFKCHVNESLDWDVQCVCVCEDTYIFGI